MMDQPVDEEEEDFGGLMVQSLIFELISRHSHDPRHIVDDQGIPEEKGRQAKKEEEGRRCILR